MKKLIQITSVVASLLAASLPADAGTYTIRGDRYLRKYTAPNATQVYNAETDAQRVADSLCDVAWERSSVGDAIATTHSSTNLDWNVANRESFDAALFCANHVGNTHVAYANAACYCYELPSGTLPCLTALTASVWSDPYNVYGARISVYTSDSPTIPTDCATVRGDATGGIKLAGIAPRITRHSESDNKDYWYPATSNVTFTTTQLGASGLQLKRYLFVFVLMENYATSRGNWLEGSSYIDNSITITTSADIPGWSYGCDICEPYATNYNLKDGHANDDDDGDGLSNYAEYLITEVFKWGTLSISNKCSNGSYPDYYQKRGQLYFGQIFNQMQGVPQSFPKDPGPLTVELSYFGNRRVASAVYIRCWNCARDNGMTGAPDAVWKIPSFVALNGTHTKTASPVLSKCMYSDFSGECNFEIFADIDGSGTYTPGEPFAFVGKVETAFNAGTLSATLSDTSPVFARIDLTATDSNKVADVQLFHSDANSVIDISKPVYYAERAKLHANCDVGSLDGVNNVRVRVMRAMVNGEPSLGYDKYGYDVLVREVVLDKYLNLGVRNYLHEGDFLTDGKYDVDWDTLRSGVMASKVFGVKDDIDSKHYVDPTNVTYVIVLGEGSITDTSTNSILNYAVTRRYDSRAEMTNGVTHIAAPNAGIGQPLNIVYGNNPTFEWNITDANGITHDSYSAFKIVVKNAGGTTTLYDSGTRPMPPKKVVNGKYVYSWTATDCYPNDTWTQNSYWMVYVFNAKYKIDDGTFQGCDFRMNSTSNPKIIGNVNNQQPMNDHGYSTIKILPRYAGASNVFSAAKPVVFQAFDNAYFDGDPVAQLTVSRTVGMSGTTYASITGIPYDGTYYVRVYADLNGNGVLDDFEPCGTYGDPIVLSDKLVTAPEVTVYIEDRDTDGDLIPDSYEYAAANFTGTWDNVKTNLTASIIGGDTILFSETVGTASISRGMRNAYLSTLQNNQSFMRTLLNLGTTTKSIEAIRVEAEGDQ